MLGYVKCSANSSHLVPAKMLFYACAILNIFIDSGHEIKKNDAFLPQANGNKLSK